jgi:chromosome segregation ATPase
MSERRTITRAQWDALDFDGGATQIIDWNDLEPVPMHMDEEFEQLNRDYDDLYKDYRRCAEWTIKRLERIDALQERIKELEAKR